jgi:hypothetical protein
MIIKMMVDLIFKHVPMYCLQRPLEKRQQMLIDPPESSGGSLLDDFHQ